MMRVSLVEQNKGNKSYMYFWCSERNTPIKFEKPGRGKVNPGQNLFGSTRLNDESQFGGDGQGKLIGVQRLSKTIANKI